VLAVLVLVSHESLTRLNAMKQGDRVVCERCSRPFLPLLGQSNMVGSDSDGYWALIGGGIGGLAADWVRPSDCCGVGGGNLRRIFHSIGNAAYTAVSYGVFRTKCVGPKTREAISGNRTVRQSPLKIRRKCQAKGC
jgi:hypothetical protein